ncbi:hypothetical protein D3C72_653970 [compost metagenome]
MLQPATAKGLLQAALLRQQVALKGMTPLICGQGVECGAELLHHGLQHLVLTEPPPTLTCQRRGIPPALGQGNREGHSGADPRLALQHQTPSHLQGQLMADGEPESGAAETPGDVGLHLLEGGEQIDLLLPGYADPRIPHLQCQPMVLIAHLDGNLPRLGELHRVVEQIGDHLTHSHRVHAGVIRHLRSPRQRHVEPLAIGQGGMTPDDVADD